MSVNRVILVGNLGKKPELRYTQNNYPVCELLLATNESWKDREGQRKKKTQWHRVIVWGAQGENVAKHLIKGSMVYVEGKIQSREWQDRNDIKRTTFEIVASKVVFLSSKNRRRKKQNNIENHQNDFDENEVFNDEIPF